MCSHYHRMFVKEVLGESFFNDLSIKKKRIKIELLFRILIFNISCIFSDVVVVGVVVVGVVYVSNNVPSII